jgi:hypothetical protein
MASITQSRPRRPSLAGPAVGFAIAIGVLTAGSAQAVVTKVDGKDLDVITFNGTYNANTSKFESAANVDALANVLPWPLPARPPSRASYRVHPGGVACPGV